jgi:hypothetical protein
MKPIISLYDESGNMLRPWAAAGFTCYAYDIRNSNRTEYAGKGAIIYRHADLRSEVIHEEIITLNPRVLFGFPPCDDLAVCGAKHFQAKFEANANYLKEAMELVYVIPKLANKIGCAYAFENPVSRIATLFRKPNFIFNPYEFGGYLPEDDKHPRWPEYIKPRDAYPKKTCIWSGNGFNIPIKKPVAVAPGYSDQFKLLGGKSAKTKQIRSETPRGFAKAAFIFNSWC